MKKEKKPIELKEGQELTTVYKVKKIKGANNLQPLANAELLEWLLNDPNPNATLDKIKRKNQQKARMSKDNPVKLMKLEMNDEEYIGFWKDLNDLRKYYAIEYFKNGKKLKKSELPHMFYLPQVIYNYNWKYWKKLIIDKRFYEHPEFMVVDLDDIVDDKPLKPLKEKVC